MSGRVAYRGRSLLVVVEEALLPNGRRVALDIVKHPGASAVVPFTTERDVLLIRQYRHAAGGYLWEVPAGKLDGGEAPAICAARELREEAGLSAARLEAVGSIVTCPGFCDEVIHLFVATELTRVPQDLGADEVIDTLRQIPLPEALGMIRNGEIRDAKTIAALLHADWRLGTRARS